MIKMIKIAKQKVKGFKAGQIANCVHQWKMLTSDPEILDIVQGAHIQFESIPIENKMTYLCLIYSVRQNLRQLILRLISL